MTTDRGLRALVIDDDDDDLLLASWALESCGRFETVDTSEGGRRGLSCLGREPPPPSALRPAPDVVFLDLNMPGLHGHEVLERLADEPDTPNVVILTSSSNPDDRAQAMRFPFVRVYEEKPLSVARATAIADALR